VSAAPLPEGPLAASGGPSDPGWLARAYGMLHVNISLFGRGALPIVASSSDRETDQVGAKCD